MLENMLLNDCFILLSEQMLKLWSWKTRKGHGKSWNVEIFKSTNPVVLNQENFHAAVSYIFNTSHF